MADKYKTLPIGTIFTYNGNKYKVCDGISSSYTCIHCAFHNINCDSIKNIRGYCTSSSRIDYHQAYYKQINETMKKDYDNIVCPTFKTNDSLNDLHVECPNGYSIDVEHSDLSKGIIKFKNDNITYIDIEDALNLEKDRTAIAVNVYNVSKLNAIDKLINIANYYNKDWKPNWNNSIENKYFIVFDCNKNCYSIGYKYETNSGNIFFKNKEDAQAVINNPNFRDILDAIYKN